MNDPGTISIIVSIVAAFSSLIVAGISYFSARKNEHDLESLKAKLAENQAEKNARRDYEYEARKRLYQQYEPLLFQLVELSESALRRISGLARAARQNNLQPSGTGWLAPDNYYYDYYMASTIYRLLAPFAIIRLIQRLLTLVDFTVDPHIANQYSLAKWLYMSFTGDFALARAAPCLEYDPNHEKWREKRENNPEKYYRQGIFAGVLDNAVEKFMVYEPNGIIRCISFGEFEKIYKASKDDGDLNAFIDLFNHFHPKTRPVLWRVLVNQACIYKALLHMSEMKFVSSKNEPELRLLALMQEEERLHFDWRQSNEKEKDEDISDEAVLEQPFNAAYGYLREHLGPQFIDGYVVGPIKRRFSAT